MRAASKNITAIVFAGTASMAFAGESMLYEIEGEAFEGYYASPSEDAPLIVIVHDWDGLGDYEKKRVDMLAEQGYAAFAMDLYGTGNRGSNVDEARALSGALRDDRDRMRDLMLGSLAAVGHKGANIDNAVVAGYCFGGSAVLEFARSGIEMKGFATFHGGLKTPEGQDYSETKGEVLVMHGTADRGVTMEDFAALASQLESAGVSHEMVTYSGAPHGFTNFDSDRYHEEADKKSWAQFFLFLEEVLD